MANSQNRLRSQKHALVNKANTTMLATIAIASVVVVFSFFAIKALLSNYSYQNRVIKQKEATRKQVDSNKSNAQQLLASYQAFAGEPINILGGAPTGNGPKDGDNPRIVLDALPSQYDFPGLISSLEKIIVGGGVAIENLGGTEAAQPAETDAANPVPTEMVFPLGVKASYTDVQKLITTLEASIRPIYFARLTLEADAENQLRLTADAVTFYQPEKSFSATKEVVK